jgi:hypothetical protein
MAGRRSWAFGMVGGGMALAVLASLVLWRPWAHGMASPNQPPSGRATATLADRFSMLSHANSNQCSLTAASVMSMPAGTNLQGSCCEAMDFSRYLAQVRGLRAYGDVSALPTDPYDIPVTLAKTLLSYDRHIALTPLQQRTYREAVRMSGEHGPCCCPCWRWDVFEGQAKFLVAKLHFSPRQVADIWNLEDGCGGSADAAAST